MSKQEATAGKSESTTETKAPVAGKPEHVSKLRARAQGGLADAKDQTPKVKVGDEIVFVGANGQHYPAEVVQPNKDGTVDLDALVNNEVIKVTSSPEDVTAKRVDSWHVAAKE